MGPGPRGSEPAGPLRCPGPGQLAPGAACEAPWLTAPEGGVDTLSKTALGSAYNGRHGKTQALSVRPGSNISLLDIGGSLEKERY